MKSYYLCLECDKYKNVEFKLNRTICKACYTKIKGYNSNRTKKERNKRYYNKIKNTEKYVNRIKKLMENRLKYGRTYKYKYNIKSKRYNQKRYKILKMATPIWADLKEIKRFFKNTPKGYHVDHIIPLQGKNVCGLNVLWNLQYLSAKDNTKKGNKY